MSLRVAVGVALLGLAVLVWLALTRTDTGQGFLRRHGLLPPRIEMASYLRIVAAQESANRALTPGCVLLIGDSLVQLFPRDETEGRGWANRGVSGDRVTDVAARLDRSALSAPCETIVVLVGSNDLVHDGATPEQVAAGLAEVALHIAAAGRRSVVVGPPATAGEHAHANDAIAETNRRLAATHWPPQTVHLDLASALADGDGSLAPGYSADGLHLTEAGYAVWTRLLETRLPSADPTGGGT